MNRILVIQISRTGDVIQSTPLIEELLRSNPEAKIEFLVLSGNAPVVQGMPGVGRILTVGETEMHRMNDEVAAATEARSPHPMASRWLHEAGLPRYDAIYNLSVRWLGRWLLREVAGRQKVGGLLTRDGEWRFTCDWGAYQAALLDFRESNRVNLVDLFRGFAPGGTPPSPGFRPFLARDTSWSSGLSRSRGDLIGINPGASEPQRRYPAAGFVDLIRLCRALGYQPVLVGAPMDRVLCEEIAAAAGGGIPNLAGMTGITQMAQLLTEFAALVSNDTGAIHMAAAVGTPVVALFGLTSRTGIRPVVHETGPWGEGHLILQASTDGEPSLDTVIPPGLVMTALQWRLGRATSEALDASIERCHGVRAWKSERIAESDDPLGGVRFEPLGADPASHENALARWMRGFFARNLTRGCDASTMNPVPPILDADREWIREALRDHSAGWVSTLESLAARARRLRDLASADPGSEILRNSTAQLQGQVAAALDSVDPGSALTPLVAFTRWKLKMTTSENGLEGILRHQAQTLTRITSWLRI